MSGEEVGDTTQLQLSVTPSDPTTAAAVRVTSPTGAISTPATTPDADRGRWTALLVLDEPGDWTIRWTVTGAGAGVQTYTIAVAPTGGLLPPGRSYATTALLAAHLGTAPPPDAARLLRRATADIDRLLITAVYDTDVADMPTNPSVTAALAQAVCEQVEWWGEIGDTSGSGAVAALAGSQIGTVKLGAAATSSDARGALAIAPRALDVLRLAGLLTRGPHIAGAGRLAWPWR